MSPCGQVYVPNSWHMTLRLGNLRSEKAGPPSFESFSSEHCLEHDFGQKCHSPRIVVETKVFRTMERCAVLQATRRALCLRNHLTSPHPFLLNQLKAQAHVQVPSTSRRTFVLSHLVTKPENATQNPEQQCVLTKDMAVKSCRCLPTLSSHMTRIP